MLAAGRSRLRLLLAAGVASVLLGVGALVSGPRPVVSSVGWILVVLGAVAVATAFLAGVVRRELRRQAGLVTTTAERWLTEVLPPARVLSLLLDRVYGPSGHNEGLVTAFLGGDGLSADGGDLTISEHTEIDYRLARIDDERYHLTTQATYSFRNRVPTDTVVIFATSDPALRDSIVSACRLPLFELWFIRDDARTPEFAESAEQIKETVEVGVEFVDIAGRNRSIPSENPKHRLRDVGIDSWGEYLTFFRSGVAGELARRAQYLDKLRIFEVDLKELSQDVATGAIKRLTIGATMIQLVSDGFCYWEAPYPCFVDRIHFDTGIFDADDDTDMVFHVKPFAPQSRPLSSTWTTRESAPELALQSWMLPGHGMALMWRPAFRPREQWVPTSNGPDKRGQRAVESGERRQ